MEVRNRPSCEFVWVYFVYVVAYHVIENRGLIPLIFYIKPFSFSAVTWQSRHEIKCADDNFWFTSHCCSCCMPSRICINKSLIRSIGVFMDGLYGIPCTYEHVMTVSACNNASSIVLLFIRRQHILCNEYRRDYTYLHKPTTIHTPVSKLSPELQLPIWKPVLQRVISWASLTKFPHWTTCGLYH